MRVEYGDGVLYTVVPLIDMLSYSNLEAASNFPATWLNDPLLQGIAAGNKIDLPAAEYSYVPAVSGLSTILELYLTPTLPILTKPDKVHSDR